MQKRWSRADAIVAAILGTIAWTVRASARGRDLFSWDSGLLATGIISFDFLSSQPHPPFYPLTIAAGKLLAPWLGPIAALSWLSVAASSVMVVMTFLTARAFLPVAWAGLAAVLVLSSPVAHFNGIAPLSYALEGMMNVVVAWTAWRARRAPSTRRWVALAIAASVAVGVRPSSMFFLGPLLLWAIWGRWRALRPALIAGIAATLAWAIPMLVAGGGWRAFRAVSAHQSEVYILHDPIWRAGWGPVTERAALMAAHAPHEAAFLSAVAVVGLIVVCTWRPGRGTWFWLAWTVPPLAFFLLVYFGWPVYPSGYLMAVAAPFAIGAAATLHHVHRVTWTHPDAGPRSLGTLAVAALVAAPLIWPVDWPEAERPMREAEAWSDSWRGLDDSFPPSETALLTFYGWNWVRLHHPDHLAWIVQPWEDRDGVLHIQVARSRHGHDDVGFYANLLNGDDDPPHPIPDHIRKVVLFQGHPLVGAPPLLHDRIATNTTTLAGGAEARWFSTAGLDTIEDAFLWTAP